MAEFFGFEIKRKKENIQTVVEPSTETLIVLTFKSVKSLFTLDNSKLVSSTTLTFRCLEIFTAASFWTKKVAYGTQDLPFNRIMARLMIKVS
mgnify:CR=1 FL=1